MLRILLATFFLLPPAWGSLKAPPEDLNFQTYQAEGSGLSLELPYPLVTSPAKTPPPKNIPMTLRTSASKKPPELSFTTLLKKVLLKLVKLDKSPVFISFEAFTHYERFGNNGKVKFNLDKLADREIASIKSYCDKHGTQDFKAKKESTQVQGLPARLVTISYKLSVKGVLFFQMNDTTLFTTQGNRLWRVDIIHSTSHQSADPEVASAAVQRIIRSVKIAPAAGS